MSEDLIQSVLERCQPSSKVLFVWSGNKVPEKFESTIKLIQEKVGESSKINVENSERLSLSNFEKSKFDLVVGNLLTANEASYDAKTLSTYLALLKPKGLLMVFDSKDQKLETELKLNGFVNIQKQPSSLTCEKPNFEIGSGSKLSFASKVNKSAEDQKVKTWQFTQDDIQEDDLINTDDLLDDLDLKKPVKVDNFDCGTSSSGKKKACKNCSCGLAQELENEALGQQKKNVAEVKSSCGSCYLGDAFRCASCPYLGMPAFKPGEKVQLGESLIKSDI